MRTDYINTLPDQWSGTCNVLLGPYTAWLSMFAIFVDSKGESIEIPPTDKDLVESLCGILLKLYYQVIKNNFDKHPRKALFQEFWETHQGLFNPARYRPILPGTDRTRDPDGLETQGNKDDFLKRLKTEFMAEIGKDRSKVEVNQLKVTVATKPKKTPEGCKALDREVVCEVPRRDRFDDDPEPWTIKVILHIEQGPKENVQGALSGAGFTQDSSREIQTALSSERVSVYIPGSASHSLSCNDGCEAQTTTWGLGSAPDGSSFEQLPDAPSLAISANAVGTVDTSNSLNLSAPTPAT